MKGLIILIVIFITYNGTAQDSVISVDSTTAVTTANDTIKQRLRQNVIKINVIPIILNSYSIVYERLLGRRISVQLGYRYQPYQYLMDNVIGRYFVKKDIGDLRYYGFQTSNYSITADVKYYISKKKQPAKGAFFGVYTRYSSFDLDNVQYNFVTDKENVFSVPLVSNINLYAIGLFSGMQWFIKKRIAIEYNWGLQLAKVTGTLQSKKDLRGLSDSEKRTLESEIDDLFTVNGKEYVNAKASNDGVDSKISGMLLGTRFQLLVGYRF